MGADEGRCFVDTSLFIYAHDRSAGERHEVMATLCRELWNARRGVVSTQVLQELYVNLRKKCVPAVERQLALEIVDDLRAWDVVAIEAADVIAAIGSRSGTPSDLVLGRPDRAGCESGRSRDSIQRGSERRTALRRGRRPKPVPDDRWAMRPPFSSRACPGGSP